MASAAHHSARWGVWLALPGGLTLGLFAASVLLHSASPDEPVPSDTPTAARPITAEPSAELFVVDPLRRAGASPHWTDAAVSWRRARLLHRICLQPHARLRKSDCAPEPGSHKTHRWREMDSNLRFRTKSAPLSETADPSPMLERMDSDFQFLMPVTRPSNRRTSRRLAAKRPC